MGFAPLGIETGEGALVHLDLMGIFVAGLLTFPTPCVLPLIPVYLSILAGSDIGRLGSEGRGQLLRSPR
jgi:cytochrome c biogenesis protein CcdA